MSIPLHASCLCEGIQYTIHGEPENVMVCYCSDCSKNAGAPYQMIARYDKSSIKILEGEDLIGVWVVNKTTSGIEKHKEFCKRCGCTLWTKPMAHKGQKVIVRTSLIDGGSVKEFYFLNFLSIFISLFYFYFLFGMFTPSGFPLSLLSYFCFLGIYVGACRGIALRTRTLIMSSQARKIQTEDGILDETETRLPQAI